jgi:hypothetical protein
VESAGAAPASGPETELESMLGNAEEDACGLDEGVRQGEPPQPHDATGHTPPPPSPQDPGSDAGVPAPTGPIQIRITRDEVRISIEPGALGGGPAPAADVERAIPQALGVAVESVAAESSGVDAHGRTPAPRWT